MRTTSTGQKLIQAFESCLKKLPDGRYTTYQCPADVTTIGWGTTASDVPGLLPGVIWTKERCDNVFEASLAKYEAYVDRGRGSTMLTWYQNDALSSWVYNCGYRADSQVWVAVKGGKHKDVPKYLARWDKAGGKVLAGLTRRRKAEGQLYVGDLAGASATAQTILPGSMPQMHDQPAPKPSTGDLALEVKNHAGAGGSPLAGLWMAWDSLSTLQQVGAVAGVLAIVGLAVWLGVRKWRHEKENWA